MSTTPPKTVLCRYHYDPLDRLVGCTPLDEAGVQRFYCKSRIATEIQGAVQHSVFQHEDQLLAQLRREDVKVDASLMGTDQQRSVLNALDASRLQSLVYTPYGHRPAENGLLSLLGFNGERPDPVTGHYLLGNGYRSFNPVLMRFNSPDSWSPFGKGGVNAYAFCRGDPINFVDPSGHVLVKITKIAPPVPPRPNTIFPKLTPRRTSADVGALQQKRRNSAPSDISTVGRSNLDTEKLDLLGYHGSTKEHIKNLSDGLSPKYMGSRNGIDSGPGFYITPDYRSAEGWAKTSKRAQTSSPQIFGVYTKNATLLKPGRDYHMNIELNPELKSHVQIIIKEAAFPLIHVSPIQSKQKAIRFPSNESPF